MPTLALLNFAVAEAQDTIPSEPLKEVIIRSYEQNRRMKEVPSAINLIGRSTLDLYGPSSVVQAINSLPGARMEERSPGSYRLNIRGSSIRSPFGVRNVKVYYNDLPITDPGGNTYINQFGTYDFQSIEIIKGPASSLYGAGTGGVVLIESLLPQASADAGLEYTYGSYGSHNVHGYVVTKNDALLSQVSFQHQESVGYREHSALNKNVISWTGHFQMNDKQELKTSFLFGDHFYETPGALTKVEYMEHPKGSRPAGNGFPSAVTNQASIRQRSFIAGASYQLQTGRYFHIKTIAYGMFTELRNPAIRNYGQNSEPHAGGRLLFDYNRSAGPLALHWIAGGEWQQAYSTISIYKNSGGQPDSLQTQDAINNRQQLVFTQASLDAGSWNLTGGLSWSQLRVALQRFSPATSGLLERRFNHQLSPRVVLSKRTGSLLLYAGLSKGFSPPATTELSPSGSALNPDLFPEQGLNTDAGIKIELGRFYADINAFRFTAKNTIVQRRDAGGGEYFINAGSTRQNGIETYVSYTGPSVSAQSQPFFLWLSHSWHRFHYGSFRQLSADYSGNIMPGNPQHQLTLGGSLPLSSNFSLHTSYSYTGKTALNDANNEFGEPSHLVQLKVQYRRMIDTKWMIKLMAGIENLLNESYSLGYDINGAGGRYYNAAPRRNYYAGIRVTRTTK